MTKTFQAKAKEWFSGVPIKMDELSGACVMDFASWLDQEAQEKPQQPERIVWDETKSELRPVESAINENLIKIGKLLEARLTHQD